MFVHIRHQHETIGSDERKASRQGDTLLGCSLIGVSTPKSARGHCRSMQHIHLAAANARPQMDRNIHMLESAAKVA